MPGPARPRAVGRGDALPYGGAGTRLRPGPRSHRTASDHAAGDWLSGRAPRSHRGGHWFDPSIAHQVRALCGISLKITWEPFLRSASRYAAGHGGQAWVGRRQYLLRSRHVGCGGDHVDLEGDPDADPPVTPHVDVWRSVRANGTPRRRSPGALWECPGWPLQVLREYLERRAAARRRAGVLWEDNGLVFTTALGTQLDAADVRRSLRTICMKAGIGKEWTPGSAY